MLSAAVLGFGAAVTFVVTFGLPAMLSPPDDVHRMAGGMFTISYTIAVIVPICAARSGTDRSALDRVPSDGAVRGRRDDFRHGADPARQGRERLPQTHDLKRAHA